MWCRLPNTRDVWLGPAAPLDWLHRHRHGCSHPRQHGLRILRLTGWYVCLRQGTALAGAVQLKASSTPRAVRGSRAAVVRTRAVAANGVAETSKLSEQLLLEWVVHKFGGTCVGSAERIGKGAQLMIDNPAKNKLLVVRTPRSAPSRGEYGAGGRVHPARLPHPWVATICRNAAPLAYCVHVRNLPVAVSR
jgi:hypothetical protein